MFSIPSNKSVAETVVIALVASALFICVALVDFHINATSSDLLPEQHLVGMAGYHVATTAFLLFGYGAYCLPPIFLQCAAFMYHTPARTSIYSRILFIAGLLLATLGALGLCNAFIPISKNFPATAGGIIGFYVDRAAFDQFNTVGSVIVLSAMFTAGMNIVTPVPQQIYSILHEAINELFNQTAETRANVCEILEEKETQEVSIAGPNKAATKITLLKSNSDVKRTAPSLPRALQGNSVPEDKKKRMAELKKKLRAKREAQNEVISSTVRPSFTTSAPEPHIDIDQSSEQPLVATTPPLELLHRQTDSESIQHDPKRIQELSDALEKRLADFNVQCQVVHVQPGPVITRYELALAAGTKASKVSGLAKDLARSLSIPNVRVVEVIPGKSTIGIEIPNYKRSTVGLRSIFESAVFQKAKSPLSLALGVDISGNPVVVDLAKMPHLLVAGTTGSGKSVGLNAILLSMLFRTPPEDLRLILIDPKMLEFAVYEGIPHLLTPVVTDMKDAASALHWCVNEMERRYKLMSDVGVRNISGYNAKLDEINKLGSYIGASGIEHKGHLPYIVVIADEFADMMMMVGKKVEQLIARLAQKARAAGIHLILATQRPSVDVITGLIKANIPTRLSFQVSSKIDSRTIIDQQGAEALLGAGDMLYLSPGSGVPIRAHGAYVSDEAVQSVVAHLRKTGQPDYIDAVTKVDIENKESTSTTDSDSTLDPLYDQAVEMVVESRKASISSVQRRLRIGYNRAASLVEKMEAEGIVSSTEATGQREVIAPKRDDS